MEKQEKINRIMAWMDKKDYDFLYYDKRCNMNPNDEPLLVADWNDVADKMVGYIESIIDIHWIDEIISCDDCGGAIKTTPSYYGDLPEWVLMDGYILCKDCILNDEGIQEEIIETYKNQTDKPIMPWFFDIIEKQGFVCYSSDEYCQRFETGLHPGQNDRPIDIAKDIEENLPGYDYIFKIDSAGQFDIYWSVFIKKQGE
jgi:hypothetical protein